MISQKKIFEELIKKDKKLRIILDIKKNCPFLKNRIIDEELLFFELSQSIVGQQISAKAAEAIWGRIVESSKKESSFIKAMAQSNLRWARAQGLSQRKHEYIKSSSIIFWQIKSNALSIVARYFSLWVILYSLIMPFI